MAKISSKRARRTSSSPIARPSTTGTTTTTTTYTGPRIKFIFPPPPQKHRVVRLHLKPDVRAHMAAMAASRSPASITFKKPNLKIILKVPAQKPRSLKVTITVPAHIRAHLADIAAARCSHALQMLDMQCFDQDQGPTGDVTAFYASWNPIN